MKNVWDFSWTRLSRWTAAVFLIIYVVPLALDWYDEKYGFWDTATHLFPAFVLIDALVLVWKRTPIGGILFFAVGIWYLAEVGGRVEWQDYLFNAGMPFIIGAMFLLELRTHGINDASGIR